LSESEEITPSPAAAPSPELRRARRWNVVWFVPLVALLLGGWLIYRNFAAQGPVARVRFDTADGIFAGKTEVRCRSVKVGVVRDVKLAEDLKSVLVFLELNPDCQNLLRRGSRFWVVKPRLSVTEFSGAETLITGAYIELDPGPAGAERHTLFRGRETPPATSSGVPGRRVVLTADEAGSLTIGAPVYFRGFEVGRIEGRSLDASGLKVTYNAFIRDEYTRLVTTNTRFWNTSGIDISAGADGFKVRTPSFQAMVSGGVSFGVTVGDTAGEPAPDGMNFTLFANEDAARKSSFNPTLKFLMLYDQTVRGLSEGAPVEFRGITIGRVADISFDLVPAIGDPRIPVLIEIDPSMMRPEMARKMTTPDSEFIKESVARGLRGALKWGSLITGALYVDLDYYPESAPAELGKSGEYTTIPTVSSGLAQLEAKITAIVDKFQSMPIEKTMADIAAAAEEAKTTIAEARTTLADIKATSAAARETLEDPHFRGLPSDLKKSIEQLEKSIQSVGPDGAVQGDLLRTLDELRSALRSFNSLSTNIDEKPNSLLFGRDSSGNPQPKAPRNGR
jgi:paraquat-inducible protein B